MTTYHIWWAPKGTPDEYRSKWTLMNRFVPIPENLVEEFEATLKRRLNHIEVKLTVGGTMIDAEEGRFPNA